MATLNRVKAGILTAAMHLALVSSVSAAVEVAVLNESAAQTLRTISFPKTYHRTAMLKVDVDDTPATLLRYERLDGGNTGLGGEHISAIIGDNGVLKGYTRMDVKFEDTALPDEKKARSIAMDYLRRTAPDLLRDMRVLWIARHDETVHTAAAGGARKEVTLAGMKVKCRNRADGLYFWVVVGADDEIVTFERDVRWITFPGKRGTEQWLHDAWLADNVPQQG
ncbi:hypothetical protein [Marinobacterium rhizophilum]|uniref:hypothetical protein n=1 Tax=Marinobacterium rhizophilum TaxID=420402 RepID=UPI0003A68E95|nr:hypothetical protein [Marinobacterium rhizophilum]